MKRPKVTGLRRRESWQALPFLLPSLLGLCLFYLFPLAETVRASFMDPLRSRAVGWGNYRALFQNTAFRLAVRNTCRFLCICIPALLAVSLLCAVLLGAAKRRAVFFKSVLLLPYAIPVASIVVLWRALFSGKGLVNGLLVGLGCRPVDFMGSSAAFWVLIFTYLWRNNGYDMLLWLAGLETIPRPLYEAAAVDGATPFQTFVFITLPNLLPTVVLTTILSLVNSFKVFREAYLVAGNYPQESIYLLQHLFNNWFLSLDIGKLSAAAVLLALGLGCVVPVLILGLLAFTVLWPLWFTVGGALMASDELTAALGPALLDTADGGYAVWTILPSWPTLQPLAELLLDTPQFFSAFWNTCLLAFAQIAGQLVVAAPASWAFAKLRFAGRRFLLLGYIALMVLPFQVLMVPNYLIATRLGIYDTPLSVILPGVFSAFPVFIMTRSFQDVPNELLEAAKLDGATAWQIFWKIGVPLGYAGIFAALVLNFIEGWNAVEQPLLFLKSQSNWPLSMYMNDIVTDNLGIAMAASLLSLIPAMLVFLYGQTYLELGIQAGGIKA